MSKLEYERNKYSFIQRKLSSRSSTEAFRSAYNALEECCKQNHGLSLEEKLESLKKEKKESEIWDFLQGFVSYLKTRGLTAVSIRSSFKRIKPYVAYRLEVKIHNEDVKTEVKFPGKLKYKRHGLSKEEIKKILDYASPARKALYLTLLSSMMRIQEACQLKKRDFDTSLERWKINIRASYTKNKSERITFISKEASDYLKPILATLKDDDLVFGLSPDSWRSTLTEEAYFGRIRERAGLNERYEGSRISRITLHSLRAFGITRCEAINDGMGHALAGHERYMSEYERYSDEKLIECYLKAEPELTLYDSEILSKNTTELSKKVEAQETEINKLKEKAKQDQWANMEEAMAVIVENQLRSAGLWERVLKDPAFLDAIKFKFKHSDVGRKKVARETKEN